MIKKILNTIADGKSLTRKGAADLMASILKGELQDVEIASVLMGLRTKGESIDELCGFVDSLKAAAIKVDISSPNAIDLCGTGGDASGTFNISTTAMFVAAGAGVPVMKHGNRSVSSKSGSYDVLEKLGINPALDKAGVEACFKECNMAFMFAPNFHPALKYVMPVRRALKIRTCFNILGPLLNPASVKKQLIGVYSLEVARKMSGVLQNLDVDHVACLHADIGLDEIALTGKTDIYKVSGTDIKHKVFTPSRYGFNTYSLDEIKGGDATENAEILINILNNKLKGAKTDVVIANAAYAIYISSLAPSVEEGINMAKESLSSGNAAKALKQFAEVTQDLSN